MLFCFYETSAAFMAVITEGTGGIKCEIRETRIEKEAFMKYVFSWTGYLAMRGYLLHLHTDVSRSSSVPFFVGPSGVSSQTGQVFIMGGFVFYRGSFLFQGEWGNGEVDVNFFLLYMFESERFLYPCGNTPRAGIFSFSFFDFYFAEGSQIERVDGDE
jgi:hypothetical protein